MHSPWPLARRARRRLEGPHPHDVAHVVDLDAGSERLGADARGDLRGGPEETRVFELAREGECRGQPRAAGLARGHPENVAEVREEPHLVLLHGRRAIAGSTQARAGAGVVSRDSQAVAFEHAHLHGLVVGRAGARGERDGAASRLERVDEAPVDQQRERAQLHDNRAPHRLASRVERLAAVEQRARLRGIAADQREPCAHQSHDDAQLAQPVPVRYHRRRREALVGAVGTMREQRLLSANRLPVAAPPGGSPYFEVRCLDLDPSGIGRPTRRAERSQHRGGRRQRHVCVRAARELRDKCVDGRGFGPRRDDAVHRGHGEPCGYHDLAFRRRMRVERSARVAKPLGPFSERPKIAVHRVDQAHGERRDFGHDFRRTRRPGACPLGGETLERCCRRIARRGPGLAQALARGRRGHEPQSSSGRDHGMILPSGPTSDRASGPRAARRAPIARSRIIAVVLQFGARTERMRIASDGAFHVHDTDFDD